MEPALNGELVPVGGGDSIPLQRSPLTIGRRDSCDITLDFANISGRHCELTYKDGYWTIRDLNSRNGIKVNGNRVDQRALRPGDEIVIAKHKYAIQYAVAADVQKMLEDLLEESDESPFGTPLLQRAGLESPRGEDSKHRSRYNLLDD